MKLYHEERRRETNSLRHLNVSNKPSLLVRNALPHSRLRRRESSDRNPVRGTAHVVQPDFVTESDGARLAAVFAADAELEVRLDASPLLNSDLHQLTNAGLINRLERIDSQDFLRNIRFEELVRVVSREIQCERSKNIKLEKIKSSSQFFFERTS